MPRLVFDEIYFIQNGLLAAFARVRLGSVALLAEWFPLIFEKLLAFKKILAFLAHEALRMVFFPKCSHEFFFDH